MVWIYLAESADSPAPYCRGCDPSPTVKTSDTLRPFFFHGWRTAPFPPRPSGTTCEHSHGTGIYPESISSMGASLVRTLAVQVAERAWMARALSFSLRLFDSFARFDRDSSSWKTFQPSLFEGSIESPPQWPRSGMTVAGTAYELSTWERRTLETDGGYLPTPMAKSSGTNKGGGAGRVGPLRPSLETMARTGCWPTPKASDGGRGIRTPDGAAREIARHGKNRCDLATAVGGGKLNPPWVEWLMGYPSGWTACADWATPWCRNVRAKPSKDSAG